MKYQKLLVVIFVMGCVSSTFTQGNWELLHPHLTSNQLVSVDFIDSENGLAVGEIGTILKTTDGGDSWRKISITWTADLRDVAFVTSDIAYVIGESGIILKTEDGGESWTLQSIEFTNTLNRVRFYDANEGWIIGTAGLILRTIDGGEKWDRIITEFKYRWDGIDFVTRDTWVLVGEYKTIMRTNDSGQNWDTVSITLPPEKSKYGLIPQDVFFLTSQIGWIGGWTNHGIKRVAFLAKTRDGGIHWELVNAGYSEYQFLLGGGSSGSSYFGIGAGIQQIYFQNEYSGTCLTGPDQTYGFTHRSNNLLHSVNSGETWCGRMETTSPETAVKGRFCFMTPEKAVATAVGSGFLTSNDGGTHWLNNNFLNKGMTSLIIGEDGVLTAFGLSMDITIPCGITASEVKLVGAHSTDFGQTWKNCSLQKVDENGIKSKLNDSMAAIFHSVGQQQVRGILRTSDSKADVYESADYGLTWNYVNTINYNLQLKGIYSSGDTLMQCGFVGEFLEDTRKYTFTVTVSTDGGQNVSTYQFPGLWNEITVTCSQNKYYYKNQMSGYHFFNSREALVVGSDGNIVRTTNGGKSWENIPSGVADNLQDILFIDKKTGFIVGNFGRILKTEDGGLTWRKTNSGTQNNIYSIAFENDQTGWAGTSHGLLFTIDGGENWSTVTGQSINSMVGYLEYDSNGNLYGYFMHGEVSSSGMRLIFNYLETPRPGVLCVKKAGASQVADATDAKPKQFQLYPNYPNPFNSNTLIQFDLAHAGEIELAIYNIQGKQVRQLEFGYQPAGSHTVRWDGRDEQGEVVSSGVYVLRLISNQEQQSQKMLYLR